MRHRHQTSYQIEAAWIVAVALIALPVGIIGGYLLAAAYLV